jgi:hypothetical protein
MRAVSLLTAVRPFVHATVAARQMVNWVFPNVCRRFVLKAIKAFNLSLDETF